MAFRINARVSIGGLLFFGTITSLFAKIAYDLQGEGLDGKTHHFQKPLFMTLTMFTGMSLCLPIAFLEQWMAKKEAAARREASEPLLGELDLAEDKPARSELHDIMLLAVPTIFDLIATVLMNIGLLWVTASVYQMMRGAEMIFAAVLGIVFLKRKLNFWHLGGILCCMAGITLVGSASLLSGGGSHAVVEPSLILLGMVLIILSQCVQAAQLTFEDYFLEHLEMPPMKIVGYEGVLGFLMMVCFFLPAAQYAPGKDGGGIHENSMDSLYMLTHNGNIATLLAIDCIALLSYNFCGMSVTDNLGAVFRTVLETMRTLFVWLVDLFLFYVFPALLLGEKWSQYSFIQAAGFVVLVTGTLVYGKGNEQLAKEAPLEVPADLAAEVGFGGQPGSMNAEVMPITGAPTPSAAIATSIDRSSFKATMTMVSGSYTGSYTGRGANFGTTPQ